MDKSLIKKLGQGAFITGADLQDTQHDILHVSPKLDIILGGGIPGGSVVTIAGDPKAGKTITALHILAKAQHQGRPTYFINVEGRIKPRDLQGIQGLDLEKLNIVRSYKEEKESRILSAEEFLMAVEHIIHNETGAVIVIDSISQLATSNELEKDIDEQARAPGAMLMARFCKRMSNVIPVNDIILIGVLHFIANTSGKGKWKIVSGGRKIQYAFDVGLECEGFSRFNDTGKEDGKIVGQTVNWVTTGTATIAPPGQKTTSIIRYGIGIDELAEIVDVAIELGFIRQAGAWFYLKFLGEEEKCQGKNNVVERLRNDKEEFKQLEESLYELLGT